MKTINTKSIVIALVAIIVAALFFMFRSDNKQSPESVATVEVKPEVKKQKSTTPDFEWEEDDQSLDFHPDDPRGVTQGKKTETAENHLQEDEDEIGADLSDIDPDLKQQIDVAIKEQLDADYKDFFNEMGLPAPKQNQMMAHYMENKQLQQELIMMLMDDNKSLDEVIERQERLNEQQEQKLAKILDADQREALDHYNQELPAKNLAKQVDELMDGVNLDQKTSDLIKKAFIKEEKRDYSEGKSLNLIQSQHNLTYKPEHFKMVREIMIGSKMGDASAIRKNLENDIAKRDRIMAKIPDENARAAFKERTEPNLQIQRNVIKMMEEES